MDEMQEANNEETVTNGRPNVDNRVSVKVGEMVGTIFLGFLAVLLLVALLRSEARYRMLAARITEQG